MTTPSWPPGRAEVAQLWGDYQAGREFAADSRKRLRAMVTPAFAGWDRDAIQLALDASAHVSSGTVVPRPTPSGVVHALDMDTLWWLLANQASGPEDVMDRIVTGPLSVPFGRPEAVTVDKIATHILLDELAIEFGTIPASHATSKPKTAPGAATMTTASAADLTSLAKVDPGQSTILNSVLSSMGLPSINVINAEVERLTAQIAASATMVGKVEITIDGKASAIAASGALPKGGPKTEKAAKLFGITGKAATAFDFDMLCFAWDAPHPHVPEIDSAYQFDPNQLLTALFSLLTNKKMWLHGHTGTGKSMFVEQVAARLGWPLMRVNFDSEITRMDLIGRDALVKDGGTTVTKFIDGILPSAMVGPYILLCDELDFIRPDVAYVFQRALEDKGLMVTEDGGRLVQPHSLFRIVATGNTQGQGDDHGIYAGARPQSLALLDRFQSWLEFDYMAKGGVLQLLKDRVPKLPKDVSEQIANYCVEHWTGFKQRQITTPLSPRGVIALGEQAVMFLSVLPEKEAVRAATNATLLKRATPADRSTISGLIDRTFKK